MKEDIEDVNGVRAGRKLTLMTMMEQYSTEEAALAYFEEIRWPNGPVCPHCGSKDRLWRRTPNTKTGTRLGLWVCGSCSETFTVRVGTVMEGSHIPLQKWLLAFYLMCASKTQISPLQLQRQLNLGSYRTAQNLWRRIRFALDNLFSSDQLDSTVKADETYIEEQVR
jgi:transposase-like protein